MTENSGDYSFESLGEGYYVCVSQEHRFGTDAFCLQTLRPPEERTGSATFAPAEG